MKRFSQTIMGRHMGRPLPILFLIIIAYSCTPPTPTPPPSGGGGEAYPELRTNREALENFQDMRFGMFVHWGPVSIAGTEIGWSRGREIPFSTYDSLYLQFNPVNFDASEWISIAKEAGMKYFVITSKHHDGFTLYDSEYTDYDIMNTPIQRDLMKEMQLACEDQGILFGTYYSVLDWWNENYPIGLTGNKELRENADMAVYEQYLRNQVQELIQKYKTNILWFDGQWESPWTHEMGMNLYKHARDLNDRVLINNRVDKGFKGMDGLTDSVAKYAGDYATPEQRIGGFNKDPWESCITICQQWAWKPNDQLKSAEECIHTLIKTVGGNGNLLFNVGPMPDGRIEARQVEVLKEMGSWLKINGEGVYGTRGGPFILNEDMACTYKDKTLYLHLMGDAREVVVPALNGVKVRKAVVLGDVRVTQSDAKVTVRDEGDKWIFTLPADLPASVARVIKVQTNTLLAGVEPVQI